MVKVSDGVAIGAVTYLNKAKAIRERKCTSLNTLNKLSILIIYHLKNSTSEAFAL